MKVKRALSPFKRRMTMVSLIQNMFIALLLALFYVLVLLGVSFIIPFVYIEEYIVYGSAVIFGMTFIFSVVKRPSWEDTARVLDGHGLSERTMTALELESREDIYANMQRTDTISHIKATSPKVIKFFIPKRQVYMGLGLCMAIIILSFIPNPQRDMARLRQETKEQIEKMASELEDKAKEGLDKADELSDEEKERLMEIVSKLSKELERSKDFKEAAAKLSKAQDEIDKEMAKSRQDRLDMLAIALEKQDAAAKLGAAIKSEDIEGVKDEIDKLKERLKEDQIDRELMDALSRAFKEVAEEISDGQFKGDLMALADKLSGDDIDDVLETLDALKDSIACNMKGESSGDPGDLNYLMQEMKNSVLDAGDALAQGHNEDTTPGGQGVGEGEGAGAGSGEGTSQGTGTGQGTGQGQGTGIGTGHSNVKGDPDRLGDGDGPIENIKGTPSKSGRVDTIEVEGGIDGVVGPVPYDKVIGSYRRQAMEAIDRKALPPGMEDIVKEYFNGLED